MATYYHGNPEIQTATAAAEGLQTLVLMNPTYLHYSSTTDTPPPPPPPHHPLILNANPLSSPPPPSSSSPHHHFAGHHHHQNQNQQQQFVGIPLDPTSHHHHHHDLHGLIPRLHYNLYNAAAVDHHLSSPSSARDTPRALSLSLSSSQQHQQQALSSGEDHVSSNNSAAAVAGVAPAAGMQLQGVLLSSKYLKAAQDLLDEVVNVNGNGNGNGANNNKSTDAVSKKGNSSNNNNNSVGSNNNKGESSGGDAATEGGDAKRAPELSTAERQEIQMKKAKLISMLDEVEQRYRQYHHQMQTVISAFQQAAGMGSAKTYTALALQTISKQFRCLKDAITGQIKAANKSLGEEETPGGGKMEGSRLKFVDHHLRQQRALQQLGMIQHNAWRPQRGLPERSVSILRAWLFEHFLHPYPKDSDKHMLAKQTGLTRSQVSNWFINARVRLWKPMVEEMYMEEMKDQELNGTAGEKPTTKSDHNNNEDSSSKSVQFHETQFRNSFNNNSPNQHVPSGISISTGASTSPAGAAAGGGNILRNQHSAFSLTASSELEGITQGSPKKPRNHHIDLLPLPSPTSVSTMDVKPGHDHHQPSDDHLIKFVDERQGRDHGYSFMGAQTNFMGAAFGQYPIAEIGRFDADQFTQRFSGNGVSLSLGLPHCENLALPATHHTFLPNQNIPLGRRLDLGEANEFGAITTSAPHSSTTFEGINIQNRKGFAAQLLPDFVT